MNTNSPKVHQHTFILTAAQCNAQRELSPSALVQQLIECSTEHADLLGCGFQRLQDDGMLWVLSRLAFEVKRFPALLEKYVISTWIENFNRHFSQRNFDIRTSDGTLLGYGRSIWVAIDRRTRRPADISGLTTLAATESDRQCLMEAPAKLRMPDTPASTRNYTFQVSDIDFNRHVNSARYVELMLNSLSLDDFDRNFLSRFDINFSHEAHYGDTATVNHTIDTHGVMTADIVVDGREAVISRSVLSEREQ